MKELKDIRDDQIRVIGKKCSKNPLSNSAWSIILSILGVLIIGGIILLLTKHKEAELAQLKQPEPALFEPVEEPTPIQYKWIGERVDSLAQGYTEIRDTLINDIPIKIYIPHNAEMTLHIGKINKEDKDIIYAAQAADVRADNGGIVGAFVLAGEPKAWGLSKHGFCASIDGKVTIGVAENSPLFEQATEKGGYFFRQYPLVDNGELVENNPKNKSIRRAICDRQGEIFMVETLSQESFHDFAQALVDLGVDNAIYLVGSNSYGWAIKKDGTLQDFGDENRYKGRHRMPKNTSYIVWRRK